MLISPIEKQMYIKSNEEWLKDQKNLTMFNVDPKGLRLLETENISLEVLRKIQDKKFEIDLEYERTRDLYEKQRVVDKFLQEHHEDNQILHGYYQNKYFVARSNKYNKHIYTNNYDLNTVKLHLGASCFSTVLATGLLALINPWLCGLMLYDYYLLAAFSTAVVNNTVYEIQLYANK